MKASAEKYVMRQIIQKLHSIKKNFTYLAITDDD